MPALRGVSFDVLAGEIVGIAGVAGNGQTELAEVISGLAPPSHGASMLDGRMIVALSPAGDARRRARPCARRPHGARRRPPTHHLREPAMGRQDQRALERGPLLDSEGSRQPRAEARSSASTSAPVDPATAVRSLSGGNIQKVVLAREFSTNDASFLLVDQPTRGVDIGAHGSDPRRDHAPARGRASRSF